MTNDTVLLTNERRDSSQDWFHWTFRVTGAAGRTLDFVFTNGAPIAARGPCVSLDRGGTWTYSAARFGNAFFTYVFPADADEVWFAMTMNYTGTDWERFLASKAEWTGSVLEPGVLCRSRAGRAVPQARAGCIQGKARYRLFVSCRHHANEAMANYVLEGILDQVLAKDEAGAWFRANVEIDVAPFIDFDGVEAGDQGKYRRPHDHNRDYDAFLYPETKAWSTWLASAQPDVYIDLHCPWIRGGCNETTYMVGCEVPALAAAQKRLGEILDRVADGSLDYRSSQTVWYGEQWNTPTNYRQGSSALRWARKNLPSLKLATSFEIPFAVSGTVTVTQSRCCEFGRSLARALKLFL